MMSVIFWVSAALVFYAFFGYPILLAISAFFPVQKKNLAATPLPTVSVLLSVFNEELSIERKIANFKELSYDPKKLELIIVSDSSTDRTDELIRRHLEPRIRFIRQEVRSGKTEALNRAAAVARGEIFLFTDANALLRADAVSQLARHFSDPSIGLVSGQTSYIYPKACAKTRPTGLLLYAKFENFLKRCEGLHGLLVGADGAIYALRGNLYSYLDPRYINDLIHPIQVILNGKLCTIDHEAVCDEWVEDEIEEGAFRRQVRIMAQSWCIYLAHIVQLVKKKRFLYALMLTSHKSIRWVTLPLLSMLFFAAIPLREVNQLYNIVLVGLSLLFISAGLGFFIKGFLKIPYLFIYMHTAPVFGLLDLLRGKCYTTWRPRNE